MAVADISASGDFAQTNTCGTTLASGASCAISVTFTPTVVGPRDGIVVVTDDGPGGRHTAVVSGSGSAPGPALNVGATSLAFGDQALNTQSTSQMTTLRNSGTAAATISGITIDGDFAQTNDCPPSLAAGVSCAITVSFTPTASGARTGTLQIASNSPGSPLRVGLIGNGQAAPSLHLMPTALTFTDQAIASQSKVPTVVSLANTGNGPANLAISLSGGDGSDFVIVDRTCGTTLAPGENCTVTVAFKPIRGAESVLRVNRSASLSVQEAASPAPLVASLNGRAVPPPTMYVHGIKTNYQTPGFSSLRDPLLTSLYYRDDSIAVNFRSRLADFVYYQDSGLPYDPDTREYTLPCEPGAAATPQQQIPVPIINDQRAICDSQSDLGVNVVRLYNSTLQLFNDTGQQRSIVLICHSMGCGITRGFLAYAAEMNARNPAQYPPVEQLIDSVTMIEGAVSGAILAKIGGDADSTLGLVSPFVYGGALSQEIYRTLAMTPGLDFNLTRPAAVSLRPESDYYQWARREFSATYSGVRYTPTTLPYFTVYGDIRLQQQRCLLLAASCRAGVTTSVGDLVFVPGTASPHNPAPDGGARFLLTGARDTQQWEWGLERTFPYYTGQTIISGATLTHAVAEAATAPENHYTLGGKIGEVTVQDCQTGATVSVATQLLRLITGRLSGTPYLCHP